MSLVLAILFSTVADWTFLYIATELIELRQLSAGAVAAIFTHASIEEIVKFLPFAIFVYKKPYFNELTDGIIYFAAIGLTFGAIETLLYSFAGGGVITIFFRHAIGLVLHGALTGVVGYSLAHQRFKKQSVALTGVTLLGVSVIHTLYNIGAFMQANNIAYIVLTAAMSIAATTLLFTLFYISCKQDFADGRTHLLPKRLQASASSPSQP